MNGPERLLDSGGVAVDRLPMLNVIFDRLASTFAESLRQLSATPPYISVSFIRNDRIGDTLEQYESTAIVAVLYSPELDARILMGFDRDFLFSMVDVLLGADGTEPPHEEDRAFSNIELRLAKVLFVEGAQSFQSAFSAIVPVTFRIERIETRMDFAVLGRRNNPAVVGSLLLQALGRGGELFVLIPQSVLTPFRHALARVTSSEPSSGDQKWARQFQTEVQRSAVTVNAILEELPMTLADVAAFKVGDVIELNATPRSMVRLDCNRQPLFHCLLGQADGAYTLQVEATATPDGMSVLDVVQTLP
ncbi:flagellar motor switch protein FliM [Chthonobacter rhizosphaerae]|uniref:flagellar motor switch protein FliM n=1 Tax=Chthonobacter rhizosphaerae TaxID=2735553 RepID=UPI001FE2713B|nr:FliM/FliN family flagellar motor switch protein [Chthonobacter rhizosphaerae]